MGDKPRGHGTIGGGGVMSSDYYLNQYSTVLLPINDVLTATGEARGDTTGALQRILYASPIKVSNVVNSVYEKFSSVDNVTADSMERCEVAQQLLEEGNSARLYTGTAAQTEIAKINQAIQDIYDLNQSISTFMDEDIQATLESYNEKLRGLKSDAKMKLLVQSAKEVNDMAENGSARFQANNPYIISKEEIKCGAGLPSNGIIGETQYKYHGELVHHPQSQKIYDTYGNLYDEIDTSYYTCTKYTYKYIKYWGLTGSASRNSWLKDNFSIYGWPWNIGEDDPVELEKKFDELGIQLPYKKEYVIEPDEFTDTGEIIDRPVSRAADMMSSAYADVTRLPHIVGGMGMLIGGTEGVSAAADSSLPQEEKMNDGRIMISNYEYEYEPYEGSESVPTHASMVIDSETGRKIAINEYGVVTVYTSNNYSDTVYRIDPGDSVDPSDPESVRRFLNSQEAKEMMYFPEKFTYQSLPADWTAHNLQTVQVNGKDVETLISDDPADPFKNYFNDKEEAARAAAAAAEAERRANMTPEEIAREMYRR